MNTPRLFQVMQLMLLSLSIGCMAEERTIEERVERFYLFNNCQPVQLIVETSELTSTDIELTKDDIALPVRSRLRAARMFIDNGDFNVLYVNVNVVSQAFNVDFSFNKQVFDPISGEAAFAKTWDTSTLSIQTALQGLVDLVLFQFNSD